jgi:hypothetical protein
MINTHILDLKNEPDETRWGQSDQLIENENKTLNSEILCGGDVEMWRSTKCNPTHPIQGDLCVQLLSNIVVSRT